MAIDDKLSTLQEVVKRHGLAAYIQPLQDEFMSEYPPACYRRLEWLTGFTGSAGTVVVTPTEAAFFTDGRYSLQAKEEVDDASYTIFNTAQTSATAWIVERLGENEQVGFDPALYTADAIRRMQSMLSKKAIVCMASGNLIDSVWKGVSRPDPPNSPAMVLDSSYSGETSSSKRTRIGEMIANVGADVAILASPSSVNWLLNIRGHDIEHTPLVLAVAIIDKEGGVKLYLSLARCDGYVRRHLGGMVELCDPAALQGDLQALGARKSRVLCDPATTPVSYNMVLEQAGAIIVEEDDPCILPKAIKNPGELRGMREAHIRDGVALTRLLHWLDVETSSRSVNELEVCDKLLHFRAAHSLFVEPSFPTISGSGPNGAIVHYRATEESNRTLRQGELFLLDSGGQYPDGTTDVTRTVAVGEPSEEHKDRFTRVLKGHIALASAQFIEGTCGSQLDALARQYLWKVGLDYDHGTGHGVGHFSNVHEGPQRISKRGGYVNLQPHMVVSNEPGYYREGAYGIRIENLVVVGEMTKGDNGAVYLGFENLTCVPIDTRLVKVSLLNENEKAWLNHYHSWVLEKLSSGMDDTERVWLEERCKAI